MSYLLARALAQQQAGDMALAQKDQQQMTFDALRRVPQPRPLPKQAKFYYPGTTLPMNGLSPEEEARITRSRLAQKQEQNP